MVRDASVTGELQCRLLSFELAAASFMGASMARCVAPSAGRL